MANNKKKNNNTKIQYAKFNGEYHNGPFIEYTMSKESASDILNNRKGSDAKMQAHDYLCKFVNEECGILGYCIRVIVK